MKNICSYCGTKLFNRYCNECGKVNKFVTNYDPENPWKKTSKKKKKNFKRRDKDNFEDEN